MKRSRIQPRTAQFLAATTRWQLSATEENGWHVRHRSLVPSALQLLHSYGQCNGSWKSEAQRGCKVTVFWCKLFGAHIHSAVTFVSSPALWRWHSPTSVSEGHKLLFEKKRDILTGFYVTQVRFVKKHVGCELLNRPAPGSQTARSLNAWF